MELLQEQRWISKDLVDLELLLILKKKQKELLPLKINGLQKELKFQINHHQQIQVSTQMLLHLEQNLWEIYQTLYNYAS